MSLKKSTTRRLSLLAGSSFVAAGLTAFAFTGTALAPAVARAANECAPVGVAPSANGPAADVYACAGATTYQATGITYSSEGDLTVNATGAMDVGAAGIELNGAGADGVTFTSTGATTGSSDAVIDVKAVSGAIRIDSAAITATAAGTTHAIHAVSSGGGDIIITRLAGAALNNNSTTSLAAVEAVTNGGDISYFASSTGAVTGRLRGLVARTGDAGSVTLTLNGGNMNASLTEGVAVIDVTGGAGGVRMLLDGALIINANSGTGAAIRAASTGGVDLDVLNGRINGRVEFSGVTAGGVAFDTSGAGLWTASGASVFSSQADVLGMAGTGGNTLAAGGSIDFAGGADRFNLGGTFIAAAGTIAFGTGADTFVVSGNLEANGTSFDFGADADTFTLSGAGLANTATINFGADADIFSVGGALTANTSSVVFGTGADVFNLGGRLVSSGATLDFGADADTFNLSGVLAMNGLTISNLETFNNSGVIYMGGTSGTATDGAANDILTFTGGVFTGAGASRIVMDVDLAATAFQTGCSIPTAADCLNFTGSTTAGSTLLKVKDAALNPAPDDGAFNTITLVAGSSAAADFTLDPASDDYAVTAQGPALRKQLVAYHLAYDATNHSHVLIGAPTEEVYQVAAFAGSAQEIWRATAGNWFNRQADLRAAPGGLEASNGLWARVGAGVSERDAVASYSQAGTTYDYDLANRQRISHLVFGADMLGASTADSAWVVGGMMGFVRSDVEFDTTSTETVSTGFTGGLYASYLAGPLFIDGVVNLNLLQLKAQMPAIGLVDEVPLTQDFKSLGGQIEAGWRIGADSGLFVEPLAGVSYVTTKVEDADLPGIAGSFDFDDKYASLRLGGGVRVGLDTPLIGLAASYSLTGRYWNEAEGENGATIVVANGASSAALMDDFSGGFGELTGSLNFYSDDGAVSGFLNLGGKFADDYRSLDGAVGVRLRW